MINISVESDKYVNMTETVINTSICIPKKKKMVYVRLPQMSSGTALHQLHLGISANVGVTLGLAMN